LQPLIAFDQFANTLVWADGEGFGAADETLSARAWRLRDRRPWRLFHKWLDQLFFWDRYEGVKAHCFLSWVSEFERHQLPEEYRDLKKDYFKPSKRRRSQG
jgi:hypothetical protein